MYISNAPPFQVGGGWGFEGGLTPATCPLGVAFPYRGGFLMHMHTYVHGRSKVFQGGVAEVYILIDTIPPLPGGYSIYDIPHIVAI